MPAGLRQLDTGWTQPAPLAFGEPTADAQRRQLFDPLNAQLGLYADPYVSDLAAMLNARASGADAPFGPGAASAWAAPQQDANASGLAAQQGQIRSQFARSGLSGSGLEASALLEAKRRAGRAARSIGNAASLQAGLANFEARERAARDAQALIAQRASNAWPVNQAAFGARATFEEAPTSTGAQGAGTLSAGAQPAAAQPAAPLTNGSDWWARSMLSSLRPEDQALAHLGVSPQPQNVFAFSKAPVAAGLAPSRPWLGY